MFVEEVKRHTRLELNCTFSNMISRTFISALVCVNGVQIANACYFPLYSAFLKFSRIRMDPLAFLKRLTCHYPVQLGYPSCDYPHIRPYEM